MTAEPFDSDLQRSLFNTPVENVVEDRCDSFLSGLSRAFTLADPRHHTRPHEMIVDGTKNATAVFVNAAGEKFRVTVRQEGGRNGQ